MDFGNSLFFIHCWNRSTEWMNGYRYKIESAKVKTKGREVLIMQWVTSLFRGLNRRRTYLSLLAIGLGASAVGMTRRRVNGNAGQQMFQPLRRLFRIG